MKLSFIIFLRCFVGNSSKPPPCILIRFWRTTHVFQFSFDEILAICWPILMQDTVLESSLVVEYTAEIWIQNFKNFMAKFGFEIEICWKRGTFDHVFLNNFLVWTYIYSESLGCKLIETFGNFNKFLRLYEYKWKQWKNCINRNRSIYNIENAFLFAKLRQF